MTREPTGKHRALPPPQDGREEVEVEQADRVRVSFPAPKFPGRSRLIWPFLMLVFGGVGGAGGTAGYHRMVGPEQHQPSPALMERLDDALARVSKLEDTTHNLELSNERVNARLDAIKDDLTDIKTLLRRGR